MMRELLFQARYGIKGGTKWEYVIRDGNKIVVHAAGKSEGDAMDVAAQMLKQALLRAGSGIELFITRCGAERTVLDATRDDPHTYGLTDVAQLLDEHVLHTTITACYLVENVFRLAREG